MATTTPVFGLRKPATTDLVNVTTDLSDNFALIDILAAPLASPTFTGNPVAPTQSAGNNSTRLATTAYANALVADAINDGTTAIAPSQNAVFDALALKAPLASPTFTGTVVAAALTASGLITASAGITLGAAQSLTIASGNIVSSASTGLKIGTATTDLLGFFNATPVAQVAGTVDALAWAVTLGFRAASSNPPLDLGSGALTAGSLSLGTNPATGGIINLPNNQSVFGRRADNAANVTLFALNASNQFAIGCTLLLSDLNMVLGTSTGTQFGTATGQKVSFHGSTPVIQRVGAAQAAVVTTASSQTVPFGYTTQAQADAIVTLVNELRAAMVEKGLIKGAA